MTTTPLGVGTQDAVALLERSLGYTRSALVRIRPGHLDRPTPCPAWTIGDLLAHMDDSLDAFAEAADGAVALEPGAPRALDERVTSLQVKACGLLGAWSRPDCPPAVRVGGIAAPTGIVVAAAALEITLHGWDVLAALGRAVPPPEQFAEALLALAPMLIAPHDRGRRFAPARPVTGREPAAVRLLALAGRAPDWTA